MGRRTVIPLLLAGLLPCLSMIHKPVRNLVARKPVRNLVARKRVRNLVSSSGKTPSVYVIDALGEGECKTEFHEIMFKELRKRSVSDPSKADLFFIDIDTMKMLLWPEYWNYARCTYDWVRGEDAESTIYTHTMEAFTKEHNLADHQRFVYFDNEQSTRTDLGSDNFTQFLNHPMHSKMEGQNVEFVALAGVKPDSEKYGTMNLIVPIQTKYLDDKRAVPGMKERKFLATFYGRSQSNPTVRGGVLNLNARVSNCSAEPCELDLVDTTKLQHDESEKYQESLLNSQFCFCPRGNNHFSLRIAEALRFGSIPVIIDDLMTDPYRVDMKKWAVVIPENQLESAGTLLQKIPHDKRERLASAGADMYHKCVSGMEGAVECMLEGLMMRR